ncbi:MAG: hypothetical protein F6J97_02955 [Leptolyngbya sp. SIO4C1]|nr:hypothetical protein [Leptolyngbya sp. SIO4C1]
MRNTVHSPLWLTYRDAKFEPKLLGFDALEETDLSPIYVGLKCPFCQRGVYRTYDGVGYVTCDKHEVKQRLAKSVSLETNQRSDD